MTSKPIAFLDADVLAAAMTRTLIIVSRAHRDALYVPRWSLAASSRSWLSTVSAVSSLDGALIA